MIDVDKIAFMHSKGRSYDFIGNELGITANMVEYYCREHGITGPFDYARPSKVYTPDQDAIIIDMRINGASLAAIGRRFGKNHTAIRSRLLTLARHDVLREAA